MPALELRSLTRSYGDRPVVRDLSLRAEGGELLVLVGPSGSGKTTTLRLIAGLERPDGGAIEIGGRDVTHRAPKDRDVAMVFQSYALYPHMTVRGNLGFALKMRRTARHEIRRRVDAVARSLGIADLLERRPGALSGGQQQRVALGRAIVREPAVFLLDEPLSNLDARLRADMRGEIRAIVRRTGTTTIHVTHDQEEAMSLGDRVAVMADGQLQQIGPPQEVYDAPANRFVAGFLGAPPMNFAEGSIERGGDGIAFVGADRGGKPALRIALLAAAGARVGAPAVLGVRPAALTLGGAGSAGTIAARVESVETLGDVVDVTCRAAGFDRIVARLPASGAAAIATGATIALRADPARLHLFEPGAFGRRLEAW
jgi:multiple sugar transport system ATP-binding protein